MKRQLQLVVALAVFGICALSATAFAGGIGWNGQGGVEHRPSRRLRTCLPINLPACSNLADDDGDGRLDLLDPGCSGPGDGDETDPATPPDDDPGEDPDVPPVDAGDDGGDGGNGDGNDDGDDFDEVPGHAGQGNGGGGKGGGKRTTLNR